MGPSFKPPSPSLMVPDLRKLPLNMCHWAHHLFTEMAAYQLALSGEKKKKKKKTPVSSSVCLPVPISPHVSIYLPSCKLYQAGPCHQRGPLPCPSSHKKVKEPESELALCSSAQSHSCLSPTYNHGWWAGLPLTSG